MTEPISNIHKQRAEVEAALDDSRQQEANLLRAIRLQFAQGWQQRTELNAQPVEATLEGPGMVEFTPEEENTAAAGPVTLIYDIDASRDDERVNLYFSDGPNLHQTTASEAADRLGVDIEVMVQAANGASSLVREDVALHRALRELHVERTPQLEADLEALDREELTGSPESPEWATNSQDESITPARVAADWVQSTTMVGAYLESDRPDLAREWIELLDENLTGFAEGGAPPGSDELEDVYHDAVARAAIPYGEAPISADEVRRQLANIGRTVPELDIANLRATTGIMPLDPGMVARKLDQPAATPAGLEDVASARLSVRRAIASITEDSEAAQTHLRAANSALTQAVDTLRPEDARAGMQAAQESVQRASEKVTAVAETAADVDAEVTLYTTPECVGCAATKRALDKAGVEYEEIPLQENPHLIQQFKKQGLAQAPIVETKDGERWAGFNPKKLREHGLDYRSRQQRSGESGQDTGHGR